MKKIFITIATLIIATPAYANGSPDIHEGTLVLLGFLAFAVLIIGVGILTAIFFFPLQYIANKKKRFGTMMIINLLISAITLTWFLFSGRYMLSGSFFWGLVVILAFQSIVAFFITPTKKELPED